VSLLRSGGCEVSGGTSRDKETEAPKEAKAKSTPTSPLHRQRAMGFSVIPVENRTRRPLAAWAEYQHRLPSLAELDRWVGEYPGSGMAIVCGRVSRLVVLDVDPRNGGDVSMQAYPPLVRTVWTGGGGSHFYFRTGDNLPTIHGLLPGVDLQAEGSIVFAPPTIHPSGERYKWVGHMLREVPAWVRELVASGAARGVDFAVASPPALVVDLAKSPHPDTLTLDDALSVLSGVKRTRGGWLARCPSHDDHSPSLSVRAGRDERLLVKCFAGCPFAHVMAAIRHRHSRNLVAAAVALNLR
jgi:hypothetical protein